MLTVAATIACLACASTQANPADTLFDRARAAFMQNDVGSAERLYKLVLESDTTVSHRTEAVGTIASIEWRVRGDTGVAARVLREAAREPALRQTVLIERSRMLTAHGLFDAARATADSAMSLAKSDGERHAALVAIAASALEAARKAPASARAGIAAPVVTRLADRVRKEPGQVDAARLLVELAAIAGDGPALLAGWRSYYLVETGDTLHGLLAQPRRALATLLPAWHGHAATAAQRTAIALALAESRFFDAALAVASDEPTTSARLRDIAAYADFLHRVTTVTNAYYRDVALETADVNEWRRQLDDAGRFLWSRLTWDGERPDYEFNKMLVSLRDRFGLFVTTGRTEGVSDLHFGHAVLDERRHVDQYGHAADLRFIAIDQMASNGYQSWAWDGRAAHGGWQTSEFIVQVRPRYAEGPLNRWRQVADSTTRADLAQRIARDSADDAAKGTRTPVADFRSVAERMERDALNALVDSLRASGLDAARVEAEFERIVGNAELESSIFAHEGRHAIDKTLDTRFDVEELEFRAKLSEVALAPIPRLAMRAVLNGAVGTNTAHGKASYRAAAGLLAWMTEHRNEIARLDSSSPLLPQAPLLTDDQLRAAFRSLDPLVAEAKSR